MIVLSNSIPKTGSTLLANLQEDMLQASGVKSGQTSLREKFEGRYIAEPTKKVLLGLAKVNLTSGTSVVKCHWSHSQELDLFCRISNVKMTMSYRDPRDMILSLIDHGDRTRAGNDPSGAYRNCKNVIDVIPRTVRFMEQYRIWRSKKYVHSVRYEDLMNDQFTVLKEMTHFLQWNVSDEDLKGIIATKEKNKQNSHNFNKGTTERWRNEMSQPEKDACLEAFKPYLIDLNYSLT